VLGACGMPRRVADPGIGGEHESSRGLLPCATRLLPHVGDRGRADGAAAERLGERGGQGLGPT
jgi:hypothetical protein